MQDYIKLLGILAGLSAIVTLVVTIADVKDKRQKFLGRKSTTIKRYGALIAFYLGVLTILLQTKSQLEDKLQDLQNQTNILRGLNTTIANSDPTNTMRIELSWVESDSLCHQRLLRYLQATPDHCILDLTHGDDVTIKDSCNDYFNGMSGIEIYFIDSLRFESSRAKIFKVDAGLGGDWRKKALDSLAYLHLKVDETSAALTIRRVQRDGEGYQSDVDQFSGEYRYPLMRKGNHKDSLGFSSLKDMYCLVRLLQSRNRLIVTNCAILNYNGVKELDLHLVKLSPWPNGFEEDEDLYLSKGSLLQIH